MGKEVDYIKAKKEFKEQFNHLCLERNLDTFQAIRILSQTIEQISHEGRNAELFNFDE